MAEGALLVGVVATTAEWSLGLRAYLRDHAQGVRLEVLADRAAVSSALGRLDVLVVDDVMRTLTVAEVARARETGVRVIGVCDPAGGLGAAHLQRLGADEVIAADGPVGLLAGAVTSAGKRPPLEGLPSWPASLMPPAPAPAVAARRGLSIWAKVSGGPGLTETVVAAADHLARRRRVLLVEADQVAPVLVSRLMRAPDGGLAWALSRAAQGLDAFPDGLSGPRPDGARPVGAFDAVCAPYGTTVAVQAQHLERLVAQALRSYEHVLVEMGTDAMLAGPGRQGGPGSRVLTMASSIVVMAQSDPDGAARLVSWRAAFVGAGATAPCHAVFGRTGRSRYERHHLASVVSANCAGHPFTGTHFLPEDPKVPRARWNAELVVSGPWRAEVARLADQVAVEAVGSGGRRAPYGRPRSGRSVPGAG